MVYQFWLLSGRSVRIRLTPSHLIPDFSRIGHIVRISLGGVGQYIIATVSWVGLMRMMAGRLRQTDRFIGELTLRETDPRVD